MSNKNTEITSKILPQGPHQWGGKILLHITPHPYEVTGEYNQNIYSAVLQFLYLYFLISFSTDILVIHNWKFAHLKNLKFKANGIISNLTSLFIYGWIINCSPYKPWKRVGVKTYNYLNHNILNKINTSFDKHIFIRLFILEVTQTLTKTKNNHT